MAISHKDRYQLSQDTTFLQRVQASLLTICVSIANEGWAIAFHSDRANLAGQIVRNPTGSNGGPNWAQLFCNTASTDATCIGAATQAGTVALTSANIAAQAALVTDTQIDNAISAEFNAFTRVPA